jgi:hypothetical protein
MWIIFAYSLPSSNPNARVKIWRKLSNIGAMQLKSSFYILPMNDTHYEHIQWTAKEVEEMGGEAVFFKADCVENIKDEDIMAMFNHARELDYLKLEKKIKKAEAALSDKEAENIEVELKREIKKFTKEFMSIKEIDFFSSERADKTAILLQSLSTGLESFRGSQKQNPLELLNPSDYQGKVWITRKSPYVDRIASFWLIKRFIDSGAKILFIDESEKKPQDDNAVFFDTKNGDFTHQGNRVTFEVIAESFGIRDKGVERIGRLVHCLDLKDDTAYEQAEGVEDVLNGIIKLSKDDYETLERGLIIFDALYAQYK